MTTKPEALRIANDIHCGDDKCKCTLNLAHAELIRQHDEIERLQAERDALLSALRVVFGYTENWPTSFAVHDCWKRDSAAARTLISTATGAAA